MTLQTRMPVPPTAKPPQEQEVEEGHELRMSLMDHLLELRNRIIKAALALALGSMIGFAVTEPIFYYLISPLRRINPDAALQTLGPTDSIISYLRVSLLIGGILAIPMMTYQLMMFVIPGLTRKEKRLILTTLPAVTGLFLVGVVFAWIVLIPPSLTFLAGFQPTLFKPDWTADLYLSFVTSLLFWMGVAFQTPLIFFVLSLMGIIQPATLIHSWRFAIVGAALAAAIITPTVDPVNMFLVMAPLLTLYMFSILLTFIGYRRFSRAGSPGA